MDECPLYTEPDLYDLLFPGAHDAASIKDERRRERLIASERFYVEEARQAGGRVLELGCGTGRLTVLIARAGVEIVGADLFEAMLEAARAKARAAGARAQFVQADMRAFDLPRPFAAILILGNSLLHLLTTEELKQCLGGVRRHLAAGGRLVFDVSKWDLGLLARDPGQRYPALALRERSATRRNHGGRNHGL
jgi:SAM-dependent methyltransferase